MFLIFYFLSAINILYKFLIYLQLIPTEDDTLGTSISLSVGENSIGIKEKAKVAKQSEPEETHEEEKWWLKKSETWLDVSHSIPLDVKTKQSPSPSPDVSSSMKEFLEKEKMCKVLNNITYYTEEIFHFVPNL